jgi:hypothetical protein
VKASRVGFLHGAILAAGGLTAGGVVVGGLVEQAASAPSQAQDERILNFVLGLEHLESAFYADAVARGVLRGELLEFARVVGGHERAHVAFLRKALGAKAIKASRYEFGQVTRNPRAFTRAAIALEDGVVAAYNGQATNLTPGALAAAARIVSVEARHAAWIRDLAGETPAEHATDAPLTQDQVGAVVRRLGFVKGGGP